MIFAEGKTKKGICYEYILTRIWFCETQNQSGQYILISQVLRNAKPAEHQYKFEMQKSCQELPGLTTNMYQDALDLVENQDARQAISSVKCARRAIQGLTPSQTLICGRAPRQGVVLTNVCSLH